MTILSFDLAFVDSIATAPAIRLNLNNPASCTTLVGTDFGTPQLARAVSSSLLADGGHVSAAAFGDRMITLVLDMSMLSKDAAAAQMQLLTRELERPVNILRYRPGTTQPVFFRTKRSDYASIDWDSILQRVTAQVLAEPFAYGEKQTLPDVTVYPDPAEGITLNANPYFETDASDWQVINFTGTFVRSTAQSHEGVASGLLTPDGVTAITNVATLAPVPVVVGETIRFSAWIRCAVARTVTVQVRWYTAADAFISTNDLNIAVSANTWTLFDESAIAPATTGGARIAVQMTGTPPASHTVHVDEARLRRPGGIGASYFDLTGIKGDVETPLMLAADANALSEYPNHRWISLIALRRRGTPSNTPFLRQAEALTLGTDATLPGNDTVMSGAGSNYVRVSFSTVTAMAKRISGFVVGTGTSVSADYRGTYRVYARMRNAVANVFSVRLTWGGFNPHESIPRIRNTAVTTISSTTINLFDLGLMQIPAGTDPVHDGPSNVEMAVRDAEFEIHAQRVSGSGNLDIDYLLFVPADDRLALIAWPEEYVATGTPRFVVDGFHEQVYAADTAASTVNTMHIPQVAGGFPMVSPNVTNRVFFVRDVDSTHSAPDAIANPPTLITPYYWPRYLLVARPVSS